MELQRKTEQSNQLTGPLSTDILITSLINEDRDTLFDLQTSITLPKAIDGMAIISLRKQDKKTTSKAISKLIISVAESLNVNNTLNESQVVEMVSLLAMKYYYLKLEELLLIFRKAKMGEYGKNYNRLDIHIVCEWIESYLGSAERAEYFEKLHASNKSNSISESDYKPTEKDLAAGDKVVKDLLRNLNEPALKAAHTSGVFKAEYYRQNYSRAISNLTDDYLDKEIAKKKDTTDPLLPLLLEEKERRVTGVTDVSK